MRSVARSPSTRSWPIRVAQVGGAVVDPSRATTGGASIEVFRNAASAVMLADGRMLVSGGGGGGTPLATTEIYDPATDTWTPATRCGRSVGRRTRASYAQTARC